MKGDKLILGVNIVEMFNFILILGPYFLKKKIKINYELNFANRADKGKKDIMLRLMQYAYPMPYIICGVYVSRYIVLIETFVSLD